MTRQEMINALIHYEIEWVIDNPEYSKQVAEFFANRGFDKSTDEQLEAQYQFKFEGMTE
jgi:hypothetical protein